MTVYHMIGLLSRKATFFKYELSMIVRGKRVPLELFSGLEEMGFTVSPTAVTKLENKIVAEHVEQISTEIKERIAGGGSLDLNLDDFHNIHTFLKGAATSTSNVAHMGTALALLSKYAPIVVSRYGSAVSDNDSIHNLLYLIDKDLPHFFGAIILHAYPALQTASVPRYAIGTHKYDPDVTLVRDTMDAAALQE